MSKKSALFVMPRGSSAWSGAEALWITVAGWAAAAERKFGKSLVVTSDKLASSGEVALYPLERKANLVSATGVRFIPLWVKTLLKDIVLFANRNRKSYKNEAWVNDELAFVWEQHDLFSGPGHKIAARLGIPLILYVHAPVVWEGARWGVRRPLWGALLERVFERDSLRRADLVACVSTQVADKVRGMGVESKRILISPMSVDPIRFQLNEKSQRLIEQYSLQGKFVVGWTGSFRGFHGLSSLLRVFATVCRKKTNMVLMLVGDGSERRKLEHLSGTLGIRDQVVFTGKVSFAEIPAYVSLFDMAVVSAENASEFHYSPLKLREYLVAQKPVLAPRAGEVPVVFEENVHLLLYTVGDHKEMETQILRLEGDASLRQQLGKAGREQILQKGTWDFELDKAMQQLRIG